MNAKNRSLHSLWRLLSLTTLFIAMFAIQGLAYAQAPASSDNRLVALWSDNATGTLLKATGKALSRSSDQGQTWTSVALPPFAAKADIVAVAISAGNRDLLYVAGPGLGVLRSKDGGRSWTAANQGLASRNVVALTTHADQADTLYAYIADEGVFRSQDAGGSWRLMDKGPREKIRHFVHSNMPGSMETGWLFAATEKGVRRSMDCFCGWHKAGDLAGKIETVTYDPDEPQRVYAATGKGLFVSTDGGEEWASIKSPGAVVSMLAAAPSGVLYAGGNGSLFRSRDRGHTWEKVDA
jgi:photosystem II stability/assembly factor-like uncharacterized protein